MSIEYKYSIYHNPIYLKPPESEKFLMWKDWLNSKGKDGWELVDVIDGNENGINGCTFKRQINEDKSA